ncbi:major facilitator superfamily domain-containing protein [Gongronella butleri]|nr:major facilitator superfamily domain-containing protein [Gongronella butleri]
MRYLRNSVEAKQVTVANLYVKVWTNWEKYALFASVLLISWAHNWDANLIHVVSAYMTSALGANNLVAILRTLGGIVQTIMFPFYSKISDRVGRSYVYMVSILFIVVALIADATAQNYTTVMGVQIIYSIGYGGLSIMGPVVVGDMTDVVNRGLFQALYDVPMIVNMFVATVVGDALGMAHWRWAYGLTAILFVICSAPIISLLLRLERRARRSDAYLEYRAEQKQTRPLDDGDRVKTPWHQHVVAFLVEIDLVGSMLLVATLAMILLPIVMAANYWGGWQSARTIGTLVAGLVSLGLFVVWEWKLASKPILPWATWPGRTTLCGVMVFSLLTMLHGINWVYFQTYLMVTRKITSGQANMLDRSYDVALPVMKVLTGYLMKRFRVWRPFAWTGSVLLVLGIGLMIPARQPDASEAFVVIAQVIAGLGMGMLEVPVIVAIQSSVDRPDLAMVTALMQVGSSVSSSIGSAVAASLWNTLLPQYFAQYVPGDYNAKKIMGNVAYAQSLPTDQYNGVVTSYSQVQRIYSIIAICLAAVAFFFTIPMQSFGLSNPENGENDEIKKDDASTRDTKIAIDDDTLTARDITHGQPNEKAAMPSDVEK